MKKCIKYLIDVSGGRSKLIMAIILAVIVISVFFGVNILFTFIITINSISVLAAIDERNKASRMQGQLGGSLLINSLPITRKERFLSYFTMLTAIYGAYMLFIVIGIASLGSLNNEKTLLSDVVINFILLVGAHIVGSKCFRNGKEVLEKMVYVYFGLLIVMAAASFDYRVNEYITTIRNNSFVTQICLFFLVLLVIADIISWIREGRIYINRVSIKKRGQYV